VGQTTDGAPFPGDHAERMRRVVSCTVCAGVIGVYEPVLVSRDGKWHEISLASEPDLNRADAVFVHIACSAQLTAPSTEPDAFPSG
jgi:hypothetical protein